MICETAAPYDSTASPGDLVGVTQISPVHRPNGTFGLEIPVFEVMHITSPVDNIAPNQASTGLHATLDEGEVQFTWDRFPGADYYMLSVERWQMEPRRILLGGVHIPVKVTNVSFAGGNFPESLPNERYEVQIVAFTESDEKDRLAGCGVSLAFDPWREFSGKTLTRARWYMRPKAYAFRRATRSGFSHNTTRSSFAFNTFDVSVRLL